MADEMVRVPEIAAMTGKPVATIQWYRHRQTAGYEVGPRMFKLGRNVVAKRADVDAWIESQYQAGPNPEIVDAADVFAVKWSEGDREWVATCSRFPSLSWLAASPLEALDGLIRTMS